MSPNPRVINLHPEPVTKYPEPLSWDSVLKAPSKKIMGFETTNLSLNSIKNSMGPNPKGPRSGSCDRGIRYSGFFGVRSVGPTVGDFLDQLLVREDRWISGCHRQL